MEAFLEEFQHLNHFNLKEIMSITGAFDKKNLIGRGGFGKVYRGVVSDSKGQIQAAFKRLDSNCGQGNPEFLKEIILLSRYTHENLISLMGFCDEDGEKILVYEHAAHGSLDAHLSSSTLTWTQRLKICLGAAKGLCYLHDPKETQQRVIHRDIKSSNILLDENWNAKVSDMGLSKIGPANQVHSFLATNVAGTFCYIDPLYMETSILTKESDVYSFGVVLFEVLCGSLCFENNNGRLQSFVRRWRKSYKEKKLEEIIFPHMKQHMDVRSLETFSEIAYRCLQNSRAERPSMAQVVEKLEIALQFQAAIAIGPLIHVLETGSSEAKENSAATLLSLSVIEDNKIWIGMSGAIGPLVDLLGHGTPRGKKDAATALFNLSIFHENKARIVQAGAVKYLVELMDPAGGMVDKAVAVLSNLATLPEGRAAIGQEGGIPMLVEVVELGSARGKENAAAALLQLCINSSRFCNIVLQEGAVPPLVALSQSGTPRAKETAQSLLSFFRNQRQANGGRG